MVTVSGLLTPAGVTIAGAWYIAKPHIEEFIIQTAEEKLDARIGKIEKGQKEINESLKKLLEEKRRQNNDQ
jgi:hypothetical protein